MPKLPKTNAGKPGALTLGERVAAALTRHPGITRGSIRLAKANREFDVHYPAFKKAVERFCSMKFPRPIEEVEVTEPKLVPAMRMPPRLAARADAPVPAPVPVVVVEEAAMPRRTRAGSKSAGTVANEAGNPPGAAAALRRPGEKRAHAEPEWNASSLPLDTDRGHAQLADEAVPPERPVLESAEKQSVPSQPLVSPAVEHEHDLLASAMELNLGLQNISAALRKPPPPAVPPDKATGTPRRATGTPRQQANDTRHHATPSGGKK